MYTSKLNYTVKDLNNITWRRCTSFGSVRVQTVRVSPILLRVKIDSVWARPWPGAMGLVRCDATWVRLRRRRRDWTARQWLAWSNWNWWVQKDLAFEIRSRDESVTWERHLEAASLVLSFSADFMPISSQIICKFHHMYVGVHALAGCASHYEFGATDS